MALESLVSAIGRSEKLDRFLSIVAYGVVPLVGAGVFIFFPSSDVFRLFGKISAILLGIILFMKPIAFVVPLQFLKRALTYRRQMGVATFWFAVFHFVGFAYAWGLTSPSAYFGWENFLLYGFIAFLAMSLLAFTSNDASVRLLKRHWKTVQWLAYPTLFLVLAHVALVEEEFGSFVIIGGSFVLLKILEKKRFRLDAHIPFLRNWNL